MARLTQQNQSAKVPVEELPVHLLIETYAADPRTVGTVLIVTRRP